MKELKKSLKKNEKAINIILPVVFGILFFIFWQFGGLHALLRLRKFQLPYPSDVIEVFATQMNILLMNGKTTVIEAIVGLCIGSCSGFLIAVIATVFSKWGYGGLTLISAFNSIPNMALAPIMNNWFGRGMGSKIAVVIFFTMAPMALNAYRGLNVLPPFSLDLMKSFNATKTDIFFKLRLQNCIPSIFTALKVGIPASLISAICAEFFTSNSGLGYKISAVLAMGKNAEGWAYITVAAVAGIIMYGIISLVERYAIRWHASQR